MGLKRRRDAHPLFKTCIKGDYRMRLGVIVKRLKISSFIRVFGPGAFRACPEARGASQLSARFRKTIDGCRL